ncbi:MAG: DUF5677 domain-containing protein [Pseudosphingobacterium sp.]|nr:DUF5677 domain-containing protein [Pseudosphingobacterium sp.]
MTSPITQIIPREYPGNINDIIRFFRETLEEMVNYGSHIFSWDLQNDKTVRHEESIAPIMSFRHFLDILDSISILADKASGDTSKILLRSAYETCLGLEYMIKEDSENRALAFFVSDIIRQIDVIKSLNTATPEGSTLNNVLKEEIGVDTGVLNEKSDLNKRLSDKESLLNKEKLRPAYEQYILLKQRRVRHPAWYQYFNGPSSIYQMAKLLGRSGEYKLLYSRWSGAVHGSDIYLGKMEQAKTKGQVDIVQLRYFGDLQEVVKYAAIFTLRTFTLYVDARTPEKKTLYQKWYLDFRERFQILIRQNLIEAV